MCEAAGLHVFSTCLRTHTRTHVTRNSQQKNPSMIPQRISPQSVHQLKISTDSVMKLKLKAFTKYSVVLVESLVAQYWIFCVKVRLSLYLTLTTFPLKREKDGREH